MKAGIRKFVGTMAMLVLNIAIMSPNRGFSRIIFYEPEIPKRLKEK